MQAVIQFLAAHEAALAAIGGILVQEFLANNQKVQSNSLGQLAVSWLKGFFASHAGAQAGK